MRVPAWILCGLLLAGAEPLVLQVHSAPAVTALKAEEVDTPPVPKRKISVRFPRSVRKRGDEAQIVLRFIVTAKGEVTRLTIVRFADPDMIEPAMNAYTNAQYTPGMKGGQPVDTWVEVTETGKS